MHSMDLCLLKGFWLTSNLLGWIGHLLAGYRQLNFTQGFPMFPDAQKKKLMSIAVASQERGVFNVQPYN